MDYYDMPLVDVVEAYKQYRDGEVEQWKQTRLVCFVMARSMGSKISSPEELLPLPGDERVSSEITDEEFLAFNELIKKQHGPIS